MVVLLSQQNSSMAAPFPHPGGPHPGECLPIRGSGRRGLETGTQELGDVQVLLGVAWGDGSSGHVRVVRQLHHDLRCRFGLLGVEDGQADAGQFGLRDGRVRDEPLVVLEAKLFPAGVQRVRDVPVERLVHEQRPVVLGRHLAVLLHGDLLCHELKESLVLLDQTASGRLATSESGWLGQAVPHVEHVVQEREVQAVLLVEQGVVLAIQQPSRGVLVERAQVRTAHVDLRVELHQEHVHGPEHLGACKQHYVASLFGEVVKHLLYLSGSELKSHDDFHGVNIITDNTIKWQKKQY